MTGRISARQLMLIVATIRISTILITLPVVQVGDARQDAWIASIVGTAMSCAVVALSGWVAMESRGRSFGRFAKEVLGPVFGFVAASIVGLSLYVLALARTRTVSLIVISQFMPGTPGWAIAIPMFALALYGSLLGPDTLGRSAELLFTILLGLLLLGLALWYGSEAGPITGLKPILARGIGPVLAASVAPTFLGAASGSVVLALCRFTKDSGRIVRSSVVAMLVSGGFLIVLVLQVLTTIGHQQAQASLAPLLSLASAISIEGIVERTDLLVLSAWILGTTFDITVLLVSAAVILGDAISVNFRVAALVLFLVGVLPVSHRITDIFGLGKLYSIAVTLPWTLVVYVGIVGLVLVVAIVKERRGKA